MVCICFCFELLHYDTGLHFVHAVCTVFVGGVVLSWLVCVTPVWSGFKPWPETHCCVLGQGTLLSQ